MQAIEHPPPPQPRAVKNKGDLCTAQSEQSLLWESQLLSSSFAFYMLNGFATLIFFYSKPQRSSFTTHNDYKALLVVAFKNLYIIAWRASFPSPPF